MNELLLVVTIAGERQDRFAELHSQLARALPNRGRRHFLDPVDHGKPQGSTAAVEPTEEQHGSCF